MIKYNESDLKVFRRSWKKSMSIVNTKSGVIWRQLLFVFGQLMEAKKWCRDSKVQVHTFYDRRVHITKVQIIYGWTCTFDCAHGGFYEPTWRGIDIHFFYINYHRLGAKWQLFADLCWLQLDLTCRADIQNVGEWQDTAKSASMIGQ